MLWNFLPSTVFLSFCVKPLGFQVFTVITAILQNDPNKNKDGDTKELTGGNNQRENTEVTSTCITVLSTSSPHHSS